MMAVLLIIAAIIVAGVILLWLEFQRAIQEERPSRLPSEGAAS
jgi:hypothetical protein